MADLIIILVIAGVLFLILRFRKKKRTAGTADGSCCSGSCAGCSGCSSIGRMGGTAIPEKKDTDSEERTK